MPSTRVETFAVDARLLRELGERLVGRPHIALAELIKNSYDADARKVVVTFAPDSITVVDDGHGMSERDLLERWLRIGTGRKETERRSPELRRSMTGSKGVGRLAAQLLSRHMRLESTGLKNRALRSSAKRRAATRRQRHDPVGLEVDWDEAQETEAGVERDLETVEVLVESDAANTRFAANSSCGTRVVLTKLTSDWDPAQFRRLAEEIWTLQPPFGEASSDDGSFIVTLLSENEDVVKSFDRQMRAILDIWTARITAELEPPSQAAAYNLVADAPKRRDSLSDSDDPGALLDVQSIFAPQVPGAQDRTLRLTVQLAGKASKTVRVRIPNCLISQLAFEVRVFTLQNRQPKGVRVDKARDYLNRFGGVHIHDSSFRLPYYGPDQDWLYIARDHGRRLSASRLLPSKLQVDDGMEDLPRNGRLYGSVALSTNAEYADGRLRGARPGDLLSMQVTRDRLTDNRSFDQLRVMVRFGLDLYAMEMRRGKAQEAAARAANPSQPGSDIVASARRTLERSKGDIPAATYQQVRDSLRDVEKDIRAREEDARSYLALLGALATAGMTSLAYEHEMQKQFVGIADVVQELRDSAHQTTGALAGRLLAIADDLNELSQRADRTRRIFSPLLDEESRDASGRWKARKLVRDVANNLKILSRGTEVQVSAVPADLRVTEGSYPAWSAVVQNLLVNSFNAVLDQPVKRVAVAGGETGAVGWLEFQDTGSGVDLSHAENYFEPFARGHAASAERAALGLGGAGLGLTIVRMMLRDMGATIRFAPPEQGFATRMRIEWKLP